MNAVDRDSDSPGEEFFDDGEWEEVSLEDESLSFEDRGSVRPILAMPATTSTSVSCFGLLFLMALGLVWGFALTLVLVAR